MFYIAITKIEKLKFINSRYEHIKRSPYGKNEAT
jgi:hypothetical protein